MKSFTSEPSRNITGYEAVRAAGKDFETYSSNLQGDRDVRDYPQLPLEVDPPDHTAYRHAIQPLFLRPKLESHLDQFKSEARQVLLTAQSAESEIDVYNEISLPFVIGCLSVIYNRPQDRDEWASWGPDVWTAASPERSGVTLHNYLARVWAEPAGKDDVWSFIKQSRPKGDALTEVEFSGYASVLLAGGRDTVIKLISGLVWHLLKSKEDLERVKRDPELFRPLINELLRFLSPLPAIERVKPSEFQEQNPTYYRLHFASANYDVDVWANPQVVDIDRGRQPHLAFGYGPHSCIGMNLAEYEARAFLSVFLEMADYFELLGYELEWEEVEGTEFLKDLKSLRIGVTGS